MSHGFRLFEVTVHDGMRRTPLPFAKGGVGGWNLIDTISELWQLHQGRTLHGLPKLTLSDVDAAGADQEGLRTAFKAVVEDFDSLNSAFHSFIETGEREELAAFLNKVADAAGLPYKNNDVSWEWRKKW